VPLKIGVMGGAGSAIPERQFAAAATRLGRAIAEAGCITITGACPGLTRPQPVEPRIVAAR